MRFFPSKKDDLNNNVIDKAIKQVLHVSTSITRILSPEHLDCQYGLVFVHGLLSIILK